MALDTQSQSGNLRVICIESEIPSRQHLLLRSDCDRLQRNGIRQEIIADAGLNRYSIRAEKKPLDLYIDLLSAYVENSIPVGGTSLVYELAVLSPQANPFGSRSADKSTLEQILPITRRRWSTEYSIPVLGPAHAGRTYWTTVAYRADHFSLEGAPVSRFLADLIDTKYDRVTTTCSSHWILGAGYRPWLAVAVYRRSTGIYIPP